MPVIRRTTNWHRIAAGLRFHLTMCDNGYERCLACGASSSTSDPVRHRDGCAVAQYDEAMGRA